MLFQIRRWKASATCVQTQVKNKRKKVNGTEPKREHYASIKEWADACVLFAQQNVTLALVFFLPDFFLLILGRRLKGTFIFHFSPSSSFLALLSLRLLPCFFLLSFVARVSFCCWEINRMRQEWSYGLWVGLAPNSKPATTKRKRKESMRAPATLL